MICDKYIKEIDHLRKYIAKLETQIVEQRPCEDAISRQAVMELLHNETEEIRITSEGRTTIHVAEINVEELEQLPSVSVAEKVGEWVNEHCSICGCDVPAYIIDWKWQKDMNAKYCPNCGARMGERQNDL